MPMRLADALAQVRPFRIWRGNDAFVLHITIGHFETVRWYATFAEAIRSMDFEIRQIKALMVTP